MSDAAAIEDVAVTLERRSLRAGGRLVGSIVVTSSGPVSGLEVSVMWSTSGSGSTDEGVAHFEALPTVESGRAVPLDVRLPLAPTSWAGELLRIAWCVRVRRAGSAGSAELAWDTPFTMVP